jgi:O-antigen ligase
MINKVGNFGIFFPTALVAILCYVQPFNDVLGTRPIPFPHFMIPSFSFYSVIFFYDELRKNLLRNGVVIKNGKVLLLGWIVRNTYY